jgi:hypothetical protein
MEASKEDLGENKQAQSLPESKRVPSEQLGHKSIPQSFYDKTQNCGRKECKEQHFDNSDRFVTHLYLLTGRSDIRWIHPSPPTKSS